MLYNRDYRTVLKSGREIDKVVFKTQYASGIIAGLCVLAVLILSLVCCCLANAETYDAEAIVDAIYQAEGGEKASKPYGILSVSCDSREDCRQVCYNTVVNNFTRYQIDNQGHEDFISFLGSKYAPIQSHPLNKNWIKNVRLILARGTK